MGQNRRHFIVAGHIDHGKSTFVGRLLVELGVIPLDRIENLKNQHQSGKKFEYSHLTDALHAEKEKGITIGISQTLFSYAGNEFVFLDAPGHHEFLQNMITGASRADLAFLLLDAKEGIKESTLRHMNMLAFLGVPETVVLINKMDLVDYSEKSFQELVSKINFHAQLLNLKIKMLIPISAYNSENLVAYSPKMPWYKGALVKNLFEDSILNSEKKLFRNDFLFIVHDVFENYVFGEQISGVYSGGTPYYVAAQQISLQPDHENYQGERIKSYKIKSNLKVKRGDIITVAEKKIQYSNSFEAVIIWFGSESVKVGTPLTLRLAKQETTAQITSIHDIIDSSSLDPLTDTTLIKKGFVVKCRLNTTQAISFDYFNNQPELGRFILLHNGCISGAGKINSPIL